MGRETPATARELLAASFSGMVFGFLEDCNEFPESYGRSTDGSQENEAYLLDEEEEAGDQEEKDMRFWDNQHQLLQATLCRTSSLEMRIRSLTREAVKEITAVGDGVWLRENDGGRLPELPSFSKHEHPLTFLKGS